MVSGGRALGSKENFELLEKLADTLGAAMGASRAVEGEGLSYRWRSLDDISPRLVQAVIASEDATFCSHNGFDMKAIEKALK